MQSNTSFQLGAPLAELLAFLKGAEGTDPNSPDLAEDDQDASWGHSQFSGLSSLLTSWHNIGNDIIACCLIAVAIKTCKVAQHVCFIKQINPTAYLSDIYLSNIISSLLASWKEATHINVSVNNTFCRACD